ncbi:MAG: hypothetical protein WKF75_02275 [Singulisphaera sp.]
MPVGRYRYSKWRWRVSVRALDAAGGLGMRLWRRFRPARPVTAPAASWSSSSTIWATPC